MDPHTHTDLIDITKADVYALCRSPLARATWNNTRRFRGTTMSVLQQNLSSLCCRGLALGWTEAKVRALVDIWQIKYAPREAVLKVLPGCMARAHAYADGYVATWTAEHGHEAGERDARRVARPRPLILAYAVANPALEFTPASLGTVLDIPVGTIRAALLRMADQYHELDRVTYGVYRLHVEEVHVVRTKEEIWDDFHRLYRCKRAIREHNENAEGFNAWRPDLKFLLASRLFGGALSVLPPYPKTLKRQRAFDLLYGRRARIFGIACTMEVHGVMSIVPWPEEQSFQSSAHLNAWEDELIAEDMARTDDSANDPAPWQDLQDLVIVDPDDDGIPF
jgi:hypothetical protein